MQNPIFSIPDARARAITDFTFLSGDDREEFDRQPQLRVVVQLGPDDRPERVLAQGDFPYRLLPRLAAFLLLQELLLAILP